MHKTFIDPPDVSRAPWTFGQAVKVMGAGSLVFPGDIAGYDLDGSIPRDILIQAEDCQSH